MKQGSVASFNTTGIPEANQKSKYCSKPSDQLLLDKTRIFFPLRQKATSRTTLNFCD